MKIQFASVLKSTLALTLLAGTVTAANAAPFGKGVHMHPQVFDDRVSFNLINDGLMHREVIVAGKTYSIDARRSLQIQAPAGTLVYAGFNIPNHEKGSVLMEVTGEMKNKVVPIS